MNVVTCGPDYLWMWSEWSGHTWTSNGPPVVRSAEVLMSGLNWAFCLEVAQLKEVFTQTHDLQLVCVSLSSWRRSGLSCCEARLSERLNRGDLEAAADCSSAVSWWSVEAASGLWGSELLVYRSVFPPSVLVTVWTVRPSGGWSDVSEQTGSGSDQICCCIRVSSELKSKCSAFKQSSMCLVMAEFFTANSIYDFQQVFVGRWACSSHSEQQVSCCDTCVCLRGWGKCVGPLPLVPTAFEQTLNSWLAACCCVWFSVGGGAFCELQEPMRSGGGAS